jgi:hypothetical protein
VRLHQGCEAADVGGVGDVGVVFDLSVRGCCGGAGGGVGVG